MERSRLFIFVLKIGNDLAFMISFGSLFHILTVLCEKKCCLVKESGMDLVLKWYSGLLKLYLL